jgi:MFS family permease
MSEAVLNATRSGTTRIIGVVSAAHFVSHYYILILAPLFPFVRAEYGVSYTQLGLALTVFNVVTALSQTPAGFLVDRFGPRVLLTAGLVIGATAFVIAGVVDSFWLLVAMFALAGIGNAVYHPADYSMLSHHVPGDRIGQAFSVHTFAGMLGSAVAPVTLLMMQNMWGWRGAFIGAGALGLGVAAILAMMREEAPVAAPKPREDAGAPVGWKLLLSAPILLNLVFFALLALISGGIYNYSVVALQAMNGTPVAAGNAALTAYLLLSSAGVLLGGLVVTRTSRHGAVAISGLILMTALTLLVAYVDLATVPLVLAMAANGLFSGVIMPSRDMIVRAETPPGSFGKVFGFVTSGFNIGGIVSPLIFGPIMDHGSPQLVFVMVAVFTGVAIFTVLTRPRRAAAPA